MTPPHDISGRVIGEYLSSSENAKELIAMMKESYDFLMQQPRQQKENKRGQAPRKFNLALGRRQKAGSAVVLRAFGKKVTIISAVDLLKGIAKCAGMAAPEVEGATGYIDTNFEARQEPPSGNSKTAWTSYTCIWKDRTNAPTRAIWKVR